ncbi:hypothetical protein AAF712_010896 [Marasmius tenuissimus]|uniref:Uncharacterized protein n=1 Tax=Marasmius tenuissimus TaxID=585030 RepID=A0ABR2ZMQ7_9AGAR
MHQIFAKTPYLRHTNAIFRLPTLGSFEDVARQEIGTSDSTLGECNHTGAHLEGVGGPLRSAVLSEDPTLGLRSELQAIKEENEDGGSISQALGSTSVCSSEISASSNETSARNTSPYVRSRPASPASRTREARQSASSNKEFMRSTFADYCERSRTASTAFRTRLTRQAMQIEEADPFRNPYKRKVTNNTFWTEWFMQASHGTIENPPHSSTTQLADKQLFLHINLDSMDQSQEPDFGSFITVWIWSVSSESWELIQEGYDRSVEGTNYKLQLNSCFEPAWVKRKTWVIEDGRRRHTRAVLRERRN